MPAIAGAQVLAPAPALAYGGNFNCVIGMPIETACGSSQNFYGIGSTTRRYTATYMCGGTCLPPGVTFAEQDLGGNPRQYRPYLTGTITGVVGTTYTHNFQWLNGSSWDYVATYNLTIVNPPPTVTAVSPATGSAAGGNVVTLTGTNLTGATSVRFNGVAATGVVVDSATQLRATAPAGAAGSASITVTTPGGSGSSSYTYEPASQTITFAAPADRVFSSTPFTAVATSTSGLAVSLTSADTSVCTASGLSVTMVSAGECSLTAAQAGNSTYLAASPVQRSFQISMSSQTITFSAPSNRSFSTTPFTATATASSGLSVTLTSADPDVCTASGITVTMVGLGTCALTASQSGSGGFTSATPVSRSFVISRASQTITFAALANRSFTPTPISLTGTASSGLQVTYSISSSDVCSVSGTSLTLIAAGTCTVIADQAGTANVFAAAPVTRSFVVDRAAQTITFANPGSISFARGPIPWSASASSGLTPVMSSSTPDVCTIDAATMITIAPGTCTLTAAQPGDGAYASAVSVVRSFTVTRASQAITFEPLADRSYSASTFVVTATADSLLDVVVTSSSSSICTVLSGVVTMHAAGTCTLIADQPGDVNHLAASPVSRSFTVTPAAQAISWSPPARLDAASSPVTVTPAASDGPGAITYAVVSAGGSGCSIADPAVPQLAFTGAGSCQVSATAGGTSTHAAGSHTHTFAIELESQTISWSPSTPVSADASPMMLVPAVSSGPGAITYAVTEAGSAGCSLVDPTVPVLSFSSAGTCVLRADAAVTATHAAATGSITFTVSLARQRQVWSPRTDVAATGTSVSFEPADTNVAGGNQRITYTVIDSVGAGCEIPDPSEPVLTYEGPGSCLVAATSPAWGIYDSSVAVATFTISLVKQTITWNQGPVIPATTALTPLVPAATDGAGDITYAVVSAERGACSIPNPSIPEIRIDRAGYCQISAMADRRGGFARASMTISVQVLPTFATAPRPEAPAAASARATSTAVSRVIGAGVHALSAAQYRSPANATLPPAPKVTAMQESLDGRTLSITTLITQGAPTSRPTVLIVTGHDSDGEVIVSQSVAIGPSWQGDPITLTMDQHDDLVGVSAYTANSRGVSTGGDVDTAILVGSTVNMELRPSGPAMAGVSLTRPIVIPAPSSPGSGIAPRTMRSILRRSMSAQRIFLTGVTTSDDPGSQARARSRALEVGRMLSDAGVRTWIYVGSLPQTWTPRVKADGAVVLRAWR